MESRSEQYDNFNKQNIYDAVIEIIKNLEIYQENKTILDAEIIMHKFFIKYPFGTVAGLFVDRCLDKLDHWLTDFIEDYLYDLERAIFLRDRRNENIAEIIKQLNDNSLEVITGSYPDPADNRKIKLSTKKVKKADFLKDLNFDDMTKESAISLFITAFKGGDKYESNAKKFTPEGYFNTPEKLLHFKKYYDTEMSVPKPNHDGIIKAYAKDYKCKDAIYKFYKSHEVKIKKLYPLATKLQLFLTLLKIEDIPKLYE